MPQYIINYKLIETRLLHTDMPISDIADEFGFTDQNHLNQMVKKYSHQSPTTFGKQRNASA